MTISPTRSADAGVVQPAQPAAENRAEFYRHDLDGLREAAGAAGGVIHLAFKHDLMGANDFAGAVAADLAAIQAMASALEGTEKPLVTTSGTLMLMFAGITGRPGTEADYAASRRRTRPSASPSSAGSSGWTTRPPVR